MATYINCDIVEEFIIEMIYINIYTLAASPLAFRGFAPRGIITSSITYPANKNVNGSQSFANKWRIRKIRRVESDRFIGYRDLKRQTDGRTDIILLCIIDIFREKESKDNTP